MTPYNPYSAGTPLERRIARLGGAVSRGAGFAARVAPVMNRIPGMIGAMGSQAVGMAQRGGHAAMAAWMHSPAWAKQGASAVWGTRNRIRVLRSGDTRLIAGHPGLRHLPRAMYRAGRGVGRFFEAVTRPNPKIPFGQGAPWEHSVMNAGKATRAGIIAAGRGLARATQRGPKFSYQRPWIGQVMPEFGEIRSGLRGMQNLTPSNLASRFRSAKMADIGNMAAFAGAGVVAGGFLGGALGMPVLGMAAGGMLGGIGARRIAGGIGRAALGGAKHALAGAGHMLASVAGMQFDTIAGVAAKKPGLLGKAGLGAAVGGAVGGLPGAVVGGLMGNRMFSPGAARGSIFSLFSKGAGAAAPLPRLAQFALNHPNWFGFGIGLALSLPALWRGATDMVRGDQPTPTMSAGSMNSIYGLDANNLQTQGLVQALHYRR